MLIRLHGLYEPPNFYMSPSLSLVPSEATLGGYTIEGHPRGAAPAYKLANGKGEVVTNAWNIQQLRRFYP